MSLKTKIIQYLNNFKPIQKIFSGKATIFMLHRIAPIDPKRLPINENMKVSPDFLEHFILSSISQGYHFISLDDLYESLRNKKTLREKSLLITIDDGYEDNFSFGYPIFKKYNIPFCIYVCTAFPEKTHNMWWFALEDYLLQNNSITYNGEIFDTSTLEAKSMVFLKLRQIIIENSHNYTDTSKIMDDLKIFYDPQDYNQYALKWYQIAEMLKDNITTIGNHTHTHPIFKNLTTNEISSDILRANELFKKHLNHTPKHFAYPFGSRIEVEEKHFNLLQNLGFQTAVTTRSGNIYPQHSKYLSALPRIFLHENFNLQNISKIRKKIIITN
ncbi:polysaccharide deacetylase family protein [Helicobacter sp. 13S00477-4]|uniref:polysaccharide deacetylase family protein n=1 Tax=Helicobacter sp. 13S00477-4 TaxID=1905759 RepID=UPI000BA7E1C1|nr:polysaccharide deacetylase family protein [Helicobacter sp. 13S00477-4]PAF51940.1 hypothetical protein BKH44_04565 [Helicobacter sp. 13S00477-4]